MGSSLVSRASTASACCYYETFSDIRQAIAREKEPKAWRRSKKVALIEAANPHWDDLSESWFGPTGPVAPSGSAEGQAFP